MTEQKIPREALPVEQPLTNLLFTRASGLKIPLSGTFELSPVCNFSCRMCYVRKTAQEVAASPRPIMTLDQWLDIARQARDMGMLYLLLTGGEPFLWSDFWPLYEALSEMGFLISINTNGSLIDGAAVERLKRRPPIRVNITLYGASDDTYQALCGAKGVFSRVDRAITALREAGVPVKLNGSLTPDNVADMPACMDYARQRGLIYETNTYMFPPVRRDNAMVGRNQRFTPEEAAYYNAESNRLWFGEEHYLKYMESVVRGSVPPPGLDEACVDPRDGTVRCRAGKAAFWITWDGWMTPCGMMPRPGVDLRDRSFQEAWNELVRETAALPISRVCVDCPDHGLCHSCAAMAITETGRSDGIPRYLCEMVEALRHIAEDALKRRELAAESQSHP